jgi:AcrR family transcriptional regulator
MALKLAVLERDDRIHGARLTRICLIDGHSEEKRLRILNCATIAFLTHGFEGANLEDIANAAGISKVTIYRFFNDKSDLFETVICDAARDMGQSFDGLFSLDEPVEAVLIRFAEHFIERMVKPVVADHPFYRLARVLVGATLCHPHIAESCRDIFAHHLAIPLTAFFAKKMDMGEMARGDSNFLATHFSQMLFFTNAVAIDPAHIPQLNRIPEIARAKVSHFLYGCLNGPPA